MEKEIPLECQTQSHAICSLGWECRCRSLQFFVLFFFKIPGKKIEYLRLMKSMTVRMWSPRGRIHGTRSQFSTDTCSGIGSPLEHGVIPSVASTINGKQIRSKRRNMVNDRCILMTVLQENVPPIFIVSHLREIKKFMQVFKIFSVDKHKLSYRSSKNRKKVGISAVLKC